jgi:arylsulfatase A-like enzyme
MKDVFYWWCTAAFVLIPVTCESARVSKPNIILILMDDFGYADCGAYGAKDIQTPNIDRLAREGVRMTDFYSNAPVCTPTRCALMTGRWQQRIGFEWAMGFTAESFWRKGGQWVPEPDIHAMGLPTIFNTLPKLLKSAGYTTGAFGKWHLGFRDEFNPTRHGFDEYFGELLGHCDYYTHAYYDGTPALRDGMKSVQVEGYLTDLISQRAVEFVRKHAREPFFLYVPHLAVHCPFQPPGRPLPTVTKENMYDGDRATYASMVERVDQGIGALLTELDRQGIAQDTLIVFTSDNGGERYSNNAPLFHHKSTLWEGGIRVPCILRWPGRLEKGTVSYQIGITMDLTATFARMAGVDGPSTSSFDGIDLMPMLADRASPVSRTLYWRIQRSGRQQKAVRHDRWKYIQDGNVEMLFDLSQDIGERRDCAYENPAVFAKLKSQLNDWETDLAKTPPDFLVK